MKLAKDGLQDKETSNDANNTTSAQLPLTALNQIRQLLSEFGNIQGKFEEMLVVSNTSSSSPCLMMNSLIDGIDEELDLILRAIDIREKALWNATSSKNQFPT